MSELAGHQTAAQALKIARWVVNGCIVLLWVGIAAMAVALAVLYPTRNDLLIYMGAGTASITATSFYGLFATGLVGLAVSSFLGVQFLDRLLAFLASCSENDPFVDANARRFSTMAWLMIVMELLEVALQLYGSWLSRYVKNLDFGVGFSMSGVIAIVALFVLARVFRSGAAMRDELRATI